MPLKIAIFLIFVSFILGSKFGHWDAIHGSDAGERWGKATREFIDKVMKNDR